MKGWYVPTKPDEQPGSSTAWYASFWNFCSVYLKERFDKNWSLSPEQSLLIHAGNWSVPKQLLVRSPKARNKITPLPHNTSLFDLRSNIPATTDKQENAGLILFSQSASLIAIPPGFFKSNATDV